MDQCAHLEPATMALLEHQRSLKVRFI